MIKRRTRKALFLAPISFFLLLSFQNCSNAPLEKIIALESVNITGNVELCLDGPLDSFTVESLYIANLNMNHFKGQAYPDSDSDGIPDHLEEKYGFDPYKRRSNGLVLDSICFDLSGSNSCEAAIPTCSANDENLGINQCEVEALNLNINHHPVKGLDTDQDGVPDILEILYGLSPVSLDHNLDLDHDGLPNWQEIQFGSSPRYSNRNFDEKHSIHYQIEKNVQPSNSCDGEVWQIDLTKMPLLSVPPFVDNNPSGKSIDFSHGNDENIIVVFIKLQKQVGTFGNSKMYFKDIKVNKSNTNFKLNMSDLKFAGDINP